MNKKDNDQIQAQMEEKMMQVADSLESYLSSRDEVQKDDLDFKKLIVKTLSLMMAYNIMQGEKLNRFLSIFEMDPSDLVKAHCAPSGVVELNDLHKMQNMFGNPGLPPGFIIK